MRSINIESVLHPKERAYRLTDDYNYGNRGNAPLSQHIEQFETYGDGLTQHSGAWCAQWSELTDVCLSLTKAIVADPLNEAWGVLHYTLRGTSQETLRFVLSIKYREDKEQWYSLEDRKVSTSETKQHDRRWEKVETWMDGKPGNALSILLKAWDYPDSMQKLCIALDLRKAASYCPSWEELFTPTKDLDSSWHQAFAAYRAACEAVEKLEYAKSAMEAELGNIARRSEVKVAA